MSRRLPRAERDSQRGTAGDDGMVTAFVVIFALALIFVAALVVDGGRMLAEHRHTGNLADSAARAGAQQVSEDAVHEGRAQVLDEAAAEAAACEFLEHSGHSCDGGGTYATAEGNQVTVQVSGTIDLLMLPGGPQQVTAEGTACITLGITEPTSTC